LFRQMSAQGAENQSKISKLNFWIWASGIACVIGIFIPVLLILSIPIFIYSLWQKRNMKERPVSPRFHTQLLPFMIYLKDEIHPLMPVQLEIDTQSHKETKPILSQAGEIRYQQTWLKGRTRLLDGSEIMFIFRDKIRELTITKTGRISGKTKTKYKTKYKTTFKVKFIADLSRYKKGEGKKTFKLKGFQKTGTNNVMFQADSFAQTFIPVYQELRSGSSAPNDDNPKNKRPIMN